MVSKENQVVIGFAILAITLLYAVSTYTDFPGWVSIAIAIAVGVVAPGVVNSMMAE